MHIHGGNVYDNLDSKVIDFSANINFMGMPKSVLEAAHKGVEMSINYPQPLNIRLTKKLAEYYKDTGMITNLDDDNIIAGNGAAEVIFSFMNIIKPKTALVLAPTFYEYEHAIKSSRKDAKINYYYLEKEKDFNLTNDILDHITNETDIVCICNPNNPTGKLTDKKLIKEIIGKCKKSDTWILIDESFMDMVTDGRKKSICVELDNINYNKIIILKSFTKLFAMPGLRLGYGICMDKKTVLGIRENAQPWNVSLPAQYAGLAAIDELKYNRYDEKAANQIKQQRNWLYDSLKDLKQLTVYSGEANFLLLNYKSEPPADTLEKRCLDNKILIRNCKNMHPLTQTWYRIAVKAPDQNRRLVECIKMSLIK